MTRGGGQERDGRLLPMIGRIVIEDIRPQVDCGRWPAKAVAGETVPVEATVFRDGHGIIAAAVRLVGPEDKRGQLVPMTEIGQGMDRWRAEVTLPRTGTWWFTIEAWADEIATWRRDTWKKLDAGRDVSLELEEGALLFERAAKGVPPQHRPLLAEVAAGLRREDHDPAERLAAASDGAVTELLERHPLRDATRSKRLGIWVDRPRALYGSWYEFFPRSEGATETTGGTLKQAAERLPAIAADGLRRGLPAAGPPDRPHPPQGAEQHPRDRPGRPRQPLGDRQRSRRPRRHPPRSRHHRRLRRVRRARPRAEPGGGARLRAAMLPRPSLGQGAPGVVPPSGRTARSPTPRTRQRCTRTSTR